MSFAALVFAASVCSPPELDVARSRYAVWFRRPVRPVDALVVRRHSENDLMRDGFNFCFFLLVFCLGFLVWFLVCFFWG
jgi:hypothetical protein